MEPVREADEEARSLELEVWRAIWGQGGLQQALDRVAAIVARVIPCDHIVVRRLDPSQARIETAASAGTRGAPAPEWTRTDVTEEEMDEVVAWCLERRVARLAPSRNPVARALLPGGVESPSPSRVEEAFLAGPLAGADGPIGVLVLIASAARAFRPAHERIAAALLAPLAAALDGDRRDHEATALRETVRSERRSVLQPLDISESIVGAETGLREVMERVEMVARTDAPVLILGETGSGKEVVARAIHMRSHRASGPILRVNCGAIPSELVDSELFGHERGSFTGAVAGRKGWFERADGGTLFLDEIGELPLAAQVRLLRILQDGSFERVGGQHGRTVDVRIVTATHRDLPALVREGRFREDLWYRIGVFPIVLPPLRDRREDIPALAMYFAGRAGLRLGVTPLVPSPEDIQRLMAYDWPGNVRELAAVVERAAILGHGRRLEIATALGIPGKRVPARPAVAAASSDGNGGQRKIDTLDRAMARHIERALEACRGRIEGAAGAAALLGINPHTLRSRMRKLGVVWARFRPRIES